MCLYFFDLTHFRGLGRNPGNISLQFNSENLRQHKFVLRLTNPVLLKLFNLEVDLEPEEPGVLGAPT